MIGRRAFLTAAGLGAVGVVGLSFAGYRMLHPPLAPIGFGLSTEELAAARALLRRHPAIDVHAHPGRGFMEGAEHLPFKIYLYSRLATNPEKTIREMEEGGLAGASFSGVADFQTLDFRGEGLESVRQFEPGEAWASYKRQLANHNRLIADGLVHPVLRASDFAVARSKGKVGAILSVEGGDFLEGKAERVAEAYRDGVRSITLMHYRNNELGDITTASPVHGGLTPAGKRVVAAMNDAGMLIDVAHASERTAFAIIEASTRPVIASHVHIATEHLNHPRFISRQLAQALARKTSVNRELGQALAQSGGGLVGAWPAGIGISDLDGFVDRTLELIEAVGIEHVCLGSDMDANYKPVFDTYTKLPHYVGGLLKRGIAEGDVAKLIGGNFLRLMTQVEIRPT